MKQQNNKKMYMWTYIKKYKRQNLGVIGITFVTQCLSVLVTFAGMEIANFAIAGEFEEMLKCAIIAIAGCLVLGSALMPLYVMMKGKVIAQMNLEMRDRLNQNLMQKSYEDFRSRDTGEYLSWYTNDIQEAEQQGFENFYSCVEMVMQLFLGAVALIMINVWLLVVSVAVSLFIMFLTKKSSEKVAVSSENVSKALEKFTDEVKEQIAGFQVLKYFGHLRKFGDSIDEAESGLEKERYLYAKKRELSVIPVNLMGVAANMTIQIALFVMCALRMIPVGVIFGGINLMGMVMNALQGLIEKRVLLAGAKPYFEKTKQEKAVESKEILPEITEEIKVENLSFAYTDTPVLRNLNMDFAVGGKYAIVGKSGCGKSTLLKLLLGQLAGYEGRLLFDGREAKRYGEDSFYHQMAYIEQNVFLFNTTIRENITLGDSFTEQEMKEALEKSALMKDMGHFADGLDTYVGEDGSQLSGGQKQRIAIARALIHKRSILIVDEGTSALDRENAEAIEDSLLKCEGLTLILVSHHLKEEKKTAYTEVYQMENGAARRLLCGNI